MLVATTQSAGTFVHALECSVAVVIAVEVVVLLAAALIKYYNARIDYSAGLRNRHAEIPSFLTFGARR